MDAYVSKACWPSSRLEILCSGAIYIIMCSWNPQCKSIYHDLHETFSWAGADIDLLTWLHSTSLWGYSTQTSYRGLLELHYGSDVK
ncbi:hypothetical protein Mapa_017580 [Marchantia paleacea]|nr:hypothetical protein Mapa_017580 [Marchantia paleacea]